MAGTYGFKKRNQDASRRLGVIAAGPIRDLGVDAVVSDCGACRMQLGHFADLPALDPVEIITEAIAHRASGNEARAGGLKNLLNHLT